MAEVKSAETALQVLGTMNVFPSWRDQENIIDHAGFTRPSLVGHYKVVWNNENKEFESYDGSMDKPIFPRIISDGYNIGSRKLPEGSMDDKDYMKFYEKKQEYFATWIYKYYKKNIETNSTYKLPNIICFGSRLADVLDTPCKRIGAWDFHAAKIGNSIFLWADPSSSQHIEAKTLVKNISKYGCAFEAIRTGEDPSISPIGLLSRKPLAVHERTFANEKYSMLLVNDIDAEDDNNNLVEIKLFSTKSVKNIDESFFDKQAPLDKALSCWSQCVVSDAQRVILGQHLNGFLTDDYRDLKLADYEKMVRISQTKRNLCYKYLERLLDFVSKQLEDNGEGCCLQFFWNSKEEIEIIDNRQTQKWWNRKVNCVQATASDLPNWFNDLSMKLKQGEADE